MRMDDSSLRNRNLPDYSSNTAALPSKDDINRNGDSKEDETDDGLSTIFISWIRIFVCFVVMMVTTSIFILMLVFFIPWPRLRIMLGNVYGHVTGRILIWILGNHVKIEGAHCSNEQAIYICNHSSPFDIILVMWLIPTGTVGIAKKEIIFYPFFGLFYVLANHIRIDRSNPSVAIASLKKAAENVVRNKLSLIIFPEGTRSKTGRLLPFKKGFVHLALQTRIPIVPIVFTGTHRAWQKGSLRIRPVPVSVNFLPPISTNEWTSNKVDEYAKLVHDIFVDELPHSQRPLPSPETVTGTPAS